MILSSIDIGTNTVLLLVADISSHGDMTPLAYEQRIPRLGRGVDAQRHLQLDSMRRVIEVLKEYREIVQQFRPESLVLCGTSAVRDAVNRDEFAAMVRGETGLTLEILSGADEALWTYRGAISGVPCLHRATVVDIGGGSTEISHGSSRTLEGSISIDVGSVRLTERLLKHDPPTAGEIAAAQGIVRDELALVPRWFPDDATLIAVAGTATTLAMLAQEKREFSLEAVTNYGMTLAAVQNLFERLKGMRVEEIRGLSSIMEGRADVITAGALILLEVMTHLGFTTATVSERGVRYGLLLREWERLKR